MRTIATIQFIYFAITGIWPLVHMPSFLRVTGPKTDLWLVRTVGLLIAVIAAAIGIAAWQNDLHAAILTLALVSSAALLAVDVTYVSLRVIPKIYLLDAAAEVVLLIAWGVVGLRGPA